jgi:hypothetical protein
MTEMTKNRIFVSYTTRDTFINKKLLSSVSSLLSLYGETFVDLLHNNSIDHQARVEQELYAADIVVLLRSHSIDCSDWVKWELQKAKDLSIPVVEVQISDINKSGLLAQSITANLKREISELIDNYRSSKNNTHQ